MEDVPMTKRTLTWSQDGLTSWQAFALSALAIIAVAGLLGYIVWAGFNEAAHNRAKDQRTWNSCIAAKQNALECRIAVHGTSG